MNTLVLLPGLQGSGSFFDPFVNVMQNHAVCSVISYPDKPPMNYAALEDFVLPLLPDHPCFLLAESFSGPLAITLARKYGARFKGLILAATFAKNPLPPSLLPVARLGLRAVGKVIPPESVMRKLLLDKRSLYMEDKIRRRVEELDPDTFVTRCTAAMEADKLDDLRALTLPVLILAAKNDRLVYKSAALDMKAAAKHATLVELDAPHFLLQSCPDEAAGIIAGFMRSY